MMKCSLLTMSLASLLIVAIAHLAHGDVIAHYSFDSDYTDSAGSNDLTSGGGDGDSIVGASQFGGGSLQLDSDQDTWLYVPTDSSAFDVGDGDFAVSLWYRANVDFFAGGYWVNFGHSSFDTGYSVAQTNDGSDPVAGGWMQDGNNGFVFAPAATNDAQVFHHVVYQRNGDDAEIYYDGVLMDTTSGVDNVNLDASANHAFTVGARNVANDGTGGGFAHDGNIDEVWVLNRALSQDEITSLYQSNLIPEPATMALMGLGVAIVLRRRR